MPLSENLAARTGRSAKKKVWGNHNILHVTLSLSLSLAIRLVGGPRHDGDSPCPSRSLGSMDFPPLFPVLVLRGGVGGASVTAVEGYLHVGWGERAYAYLTDSATLIWKPRRENRNGDLEVSVEKFWGKEFGRCGLGTRSCDIPIIGT